MNTVPSYIRFAIASLFFTHCAATTNVVATWSDPEYTEKQYEKVLVIAVTDKAGPRKNFERDFVELLKTHGIDAINSNGLLPQDSKPSVETVKQAIHNQEIDAVLALRLIEIDREVVEETPTLETSPHSLTSGYDRMMTGYMSTEISSPTFAETVIVRARTTLWDVADEKAIWFAESETYDPTAETAEKDRQAFTKRIVGNLLKKTNYLPPQQTPEQQ